MEPAAEKNPLRAGSTLNQVATQKFIVETHQPKLIESLERVVDHVTQDNTGGGEALARLLMNCYDYSEYSFDLTELCRLDDDFFEDALNVIRLRCRQNLEPHTFFVDGGRLFNQIAADYGIDRKTPLTDEDLLS